MESGAKSAESGSPTNVEKPKYLAPQLLFPILMIAVIAIPFSFRLSGAVGQQVGYRFATRYFSSEEYWLIAFRTIAIGVFAVCQLLVFLLIAMILKGAIRKWGKVKG